MEKTKGFITVEKNLHFCGDEDFDAKYFAFFLEPKNYLITGDSMMAGAGSRIEILYPFIKRQWGKTHKVVLGDGALADLKLFRRGIRTKSKLKQAMRRMSLVDCYAHRNKNLLRDVMKYRYGA